MNAETLIISMNSDVRPPARVELGDYTAERQTARDYGTPVGGRAELLLEAIETLAKIAEAHQPGRRAWKTAKKQPPLLLSGD